MSTLQSRIEDYVGTFADTTALTDWLTAGAKQLIELIPYDKLEDIATEGTDNGTDGYSVLGKKVLRVHKSNYGAAYVSPGLYSQASNSSSIYYALATDPVWTKKGAKIFVLPGGGSIVYVAYPTVTYSDTSISGFPTEMEHLVVLWATKQACVYLLASATSNISSGTLPTAPTAPNAPSFTYTDASGTTVTVTTISISDLTLPVYASPVMSLPSVPSDLSISASAPTAPDAPSFTYTDAFGTVVTTTSISLSGITPPVYTSPSIESMPVWNLGGLTVSASAPTPPSPPVITYTNANAGTFTEQSLTFTTSPPSYIKVSVPSGLDLSDSSDTYTFTDTDEDLEKAQTEISRQVQLLNLYNSDIQQELNKFNKELAAYRAELERSIEDARHAAQNEISKSQATTDLNLKNAYEQKAALISEYQLSLERYRNEVQSYSATVNNEIGEYTANISSYTAQIEAVIRQYQLDIQNAFNAFQDTLEEYKAEVQTAINNGQLLQQKLLADAERQDNIDLANKAKALEKQISEYNAGLNKFSNEINSYGQEVRSEVEEFNANVSKWTVDRQTLLQQYQADIQNEANRFNKDLSIYQARVNEKLENARLLQQKLLDDAQRADNIDLANKAKDLEEQISEYSSSLGKFQNEINLYASEVNAYATDIQMYSNQAQNYLGVLTAVTNEYNTLLTSYTGVKYGNA